jgi:hypothetical protein
MERDLGDAVNISLSLILKGFRAADKRLQGACDKHGGTETAVKGYEPYRHSETEASEMKKIPSMI